MRIIAVSSGKGGVGKTNVVANLALALVRKGHKVLIFDADLGLANIDVLLGLSPQKDIRDVLSGEVRLKEIIIKTKYGFGVIPASSGIVELTRLDSSEKFLLKEQFEEVTEDLDFLIFDLAAGIADNVLFFNLVAQERIVVTTPEPTAMADAYALIKVLFRRYQVKRFYFLVNMIKDAREGKAVYQQLFRVIERFLGTVGLTYLGGLRNDPCVPQAVRQQEPFLEVCPDSKVSHDLLAVADKLLKLEPDVHGGIELLWSGNFQAA